MRILIVGLGSMGKRRIRNLRHLGAGELIGFDLRPDRCAEAAARYGIATVATLEEGFDRGPDAVIISTPPDLHVAYAVEAARRGVHFFTEASVVDDGIEELLALLRARPGLVGVPSCTMRYYPGPKAVAEIVRGGEIGRPLTFVYQVGQYLPDWHPWEDYRSYYVSVRRTGACREIVPFELNWLVPLFGSVIDVAAATGKLGDLDGKIDDCYQMLFRFRGGVRGVMQVDVLARSPVRHFRLLGTEGNVEWSADNGTVRMYTAANKAWTERLIESITVEPGYASWAGEEPYVAELRDFLTAVQDKASFGHSFAEDSQLLRTLEAVEMSAARGGVVTLAALHAG